MSNSVEFFSECIAVTAQLVQHTVALDKRHTWEIQYTAPHYHTLARHTLSTSVVISKQPDNVLAGYPADFAHEFDRVRIRFSFHQGVWLVLNRSPPHYC